MGTVGRGGGGGVWGGCGGLVKRELGPLHYPHDARGAASSPLLLPLMLPLPLLCHGAWCVAAAVVVVLQTGTRGPGVLSASKRRKLSAGQRADPLKAAGQQAAGRGGGGQHGHGQAPAGAAAAPAAAVFLPAPRKGDSHLNEELTEMEVSARAGGRGPGERAGREGGGRGGCGPRAGHLGGGVLGGGGGRGQGGERGCHGWGAAGRCASCM